MSIHVMSLVYRKKFGSPTAKLIALKLADHAGDDGGEIFPSVERISSECELSERQVQRTLKSMVEAGLLMVTKPGGGKGNTTHYDMDLAAIEALQDTYSKPRHNVTVTNAKGDIDDAKGDTQSSKGDSVSPEPSLTTIEPKKGFSDFRKKWIGGEHHVLATTDAWHQWRMFLKTKKIDMPNPIVNGGYYFKTPLPPPTSEVE